MDKKAGSVTRKATTIVHAAATLTTLILLGLTILGLVMAYHAIWERLK